MKRFIQGFIISILFFAPFSVHAEEIASFHSAIDIRADGSFSIKEKILYDFGNLKKHGIYRNLIQTRTNEANETYRFTFRDMSVKNENNASYPFTKSSKGDNLQLKIGDADTLITGKKEYDLGYTVQGGITYFSDHDELYWQITGTEWTVDIASASATIMLPVATDAATLRLSCFTGATTSNASDCDITSDGKEVVVATRQALFPGEGLTIVVGFPKGMVAVMEPQKMVPWDHTWWGKILMALITVGVFLWYIGLPIWIVIRWFQVGRDPTPPMGETKAWFAAPKTASLRSLAPGETGTLLDESADMQDITATIIDLARRGYLKIIEKKKNDFSLEKRDAAEKGDTLEPFEKILYDGIFSKGSTIRIKDAKLVQTVEKTKKALYESVVREKFFDKNPDTTRTLYIVLGVAAIFTMNFPLALAAFIFGRIMPKKTMLGAQTAAVGRSLKNFITSQDRQFAYQAQKQLFFEKFLPFAVAFGVEKIWAERFKDIKLTKPDWYDGYGTNVFTSTNFVNSLNTSMTSVVHAATPTSSSSGFSSGFSGGSVGGGGGGGGGGSW